ncbi:MAG: carboxymuconolactone decarboxylase family protein [Pyrinomonadaceae bacterium]
MTDFELLLSATPGFQRRIAELRDSVLREGPLDPRGRSLAVVAVALATQHPALNEVLAWAKQQGLVNEEIGHLAAIASALKATHFGAANGSGGGSAQPESATCC